MQFSWKITSCVLIFWNQKRNVSWQSSPFSNNSFCSKCKTWQIFHCFLFRLILDYLGEPPGYIKRLFCEKKFMSQVWFQRLPWRSDRKRWTNPAERSEQIKLVRFNEIHRSTWIILLKMHVHTRKNFTCLLPNTTEIINAYFLFYHVPDASCNVWECVLGFMRSWVLSGPVKFEERCWMVAWHPLCPFRTYDGCA